MTYVFEGMMTAREDELFSPWFAASLTGTEVPVKIPGHADVTGTIVSVTVEDGGKTLLFTVKVEGETPPVGELVFRLGGV